MTQFLLSGFVKPICKFCNIEMRKAGTMAKVKDNKVKQITIFECSGCRLTLRQEIGQ